jgi:hypothetical protein
MERKTGYEHCGVSGRRPNVYQAQPERLSALRVGSGSGMRSQCCLQGRAIVIPLYKLNDTPAAQGFDSFQHVYCEHGRMLGNDMSLNFVWASPHDVAKRATSPGHVAPLHVSFELLNASKVFVARCADRSWTATHCTFSLILREVLVREMPSGPMVLGIVVKIGGVCLRGRKIGL